MSGSGRVDELRLWQVALVEGIFVVVAVAIIHFRHSLGDIAFRLPLLTEVGIGLLLGVVLGALTGFGVLRSRLREAVVHGVLPFRPVTASAWSIVVLGLLAGVGEELLFRAALQVWIGIIWASLLFGIAHGGTARLHEGISAGKIVYLAAAVAAGVLLGLLYDSAGLLASMSAHAAFDTTFLLALAPAIATAAATAPAVTRGSVTSDERIEQNVTR